MQDYYERTRKCIDEYNRIADKIKYRVDDTSYKEDEFLDHHYTLLSEALVEDIQDKSFLKVLMDVCRKKLEER